jgi:hypothetical protein
MIPDSAAAIAAHIKAAELLFQAFGPEACQDGFLHTLFVGFRPLLVCETDFLHSKDHVNIGST